MERELAIGQHDAIDASGDREDDLVRMTSLPPCPGLPSSDREIAAAIARARGQIAEGRGVPGEEVSRWAAALGTADERPMPNEWLA